MVLLNSVSQADPAMRQLQLTKTMWRFDPPKAAKLFSLQQKRAWWKLFLAGVMVSCIIVSMTARALPTAHCLAISGAFFVLWTIFLVWYWYAKLTQQAAAPSVGPGPAEAEGVREEVNEQLLTWKARVRAKDDDKDKDKDSRLPVTIVTGFLGAGKTTLVKSILSNTAGMRVLVIENEIGAEGIDHDLLMQQTGREDVVLMNNGCICCTVRSDLLATFRRMFANEAFAQLDWVVIEASGLADPAPLIQSLYMDADCQRRLRLDGVLAVVDAKHLLSAQQLTAPSAHSSSTASEAQRQIAYADRVLLSKTDLVTPEEVQAVRRSVQAINSSATVMLSLRGQVDVREVLNIRAFSPSKAIALLSSSTTEEVGPIVIRRDPAGQLLRKPSRWSSSPSPTPSTGLSTISLLAADPLDLDRFNVWMSQLLKTQGAALYRIKGILWMQGYEERFVAQGIHMIFEGERAGPWEEGEGERRSRLVIIGLGLDPAELRDGFARTIAST